MSWRIEHSDALSILRELPNDWAQTCVTSPPRTCAFAEVLAVLSETRRVLREDSTLWLLTYQAQPFRDALVDIDFRAQHAPRWAAPLAAHGGPRLLLFTKDAKFFCEEQRLDRPRSNRPSCPRSGVARVNAMPCRDELFFQLTRRCILAGSSPAACGVCGAPYRRARPHERTQGTRLATCIHRNEMGCCLVLDPFCSPGTFTVELAHRYGRNFLGVTNTAGVGQCR